jgi:hypothetical protein
MYETNRWVEAGGLMSYGASDPESFQRAAVYVDKILKGTKPADLPVEQPTKFEFVINLKTAKALNLTIPQSVISHPQNPLIKSFFGEKWPHSVWYRRAISCAEVNDGTVTNDRRSGRPSESEEKYTLHLGL